MSKKIKVTFEQNEKNAIVDMEFFEDGEIGIGISFNPEIHGNEKCEYLWALDEFIKILKH